MSDGISDSLIKEKDFSWRGKVTMNIQEFHFNEQMFL